MTIRHERVDDVPLILALANRLQLAQLLEQQLGTHGLQQGLNNGQLAVGWLAYGLSQGDHRKVAVRAWAQDLAETLAAGLGQPLREVDFSDDRLAGVLRRLSDDAVWCAIEHDLWQRLATITATPLRCIRLDSTTVRGYHTVRPDGLLQFGYSSDRRTDLPHLKVMAAAAQPGGLLIATEVLPGQRADDGLYRPLIERTRAIVGQTGVLYTGDSKMAAIATRAALVAAGDHYLVPLPLTGDTPTWLAQWVEAIVEGEQPATLIWDEPAPTPGQAMPVARLLAAGYERSHREILWLDEQQTVEWVERSLIGRSAALAEQQQAGLERRLSAAQTALAGLTPEPGRGRRVFTDEAALREAIAVIERRYEVGGFLRVTLTTQTTTQVKRAQPGRPGPDAPTREIHHTRVHIATVARDEAAITARGHRLGWRLYATSAPIDHLSFDEAIRTYRGGWSLERDFHLLKDAPLGIRPLYVTTTPQIVGLTRLLTLALRLLVLLETQVRFGLAQGQPTLTGLYVGQPTRVTTRPTGVALLRAVARAKLTLTVITQPGASVIRHLTPLPPLVGHVLALLQLPPDCYTSLIANSPPLLLSSRER